MPDEKPEGEETPETEETPEVEEETPSTDEELAAARKELASLKRSNAALKAQNARSRSRKPKDQEDDPGPTEREQELQKQLEESDAKASALERRFHRSGAASIAREMGAHDADFVADALDFDEIADPEDKREVKQAIARLRKAKPFLFKEDDVDQGNREGRPQSSDMNRLIRRGLTGSE